MLADELRYAAIPTALFFALFFMQPMAGAALYVWGRNQVETHLMRRVIAAFDDETCQRLRESKRELMLLFSPLPVFSAPALVERFLG